MPETREKHYPSTRYHPSAAPVRVNDEKHEAIVAPPEAGWVESPADLPIEPMDPSKCATCGQKLPVAKNAKKGE